MGYERETGGFVASWGKRGSLAVVILWYVVATAAGVLAVHVLEDLTEGFALTTGEYGPLVLAAVADFVGTVTIWISAILVNNSSMYDPYWSVFTPFALVYWVVDSVRVGGKTVPTTRIVLIFLSTWIWALRLTSNWVRDWPGLYHEDFRYVQIRQGFQSKNLPKFTFWIIGSFLGIMLFPTVQVFLGSIPVFAAVSSGVSGEEENSNPLNWLDFVAVTICVGAAILQYIADEQMRKFRNNASRDPLDVMDTGLWAYSRHPNYFGEISFWFGLYIHALAVNASKFWWTGVGFLSITLMFVFASIPLMEKRMMLRRPAYKDTIQTTPMLIPMPRATIARTSPME